MIAALLTLAIVVTAPPVPAFGGITLGTQVSQTIAKRGNPAVSTTDVGTVWTWQRDDGTLRLTTDDDGNVRIIDLAPASSADPVIVLPAPGHKHVAFNSTTADAAKQSLSSFIDFDANAAFPDNGAPAELQTYKLDESHELALLFDTTSHLLREAFYGERPALARAGLLPDVAKTLPSFKAPVLQKLGAADYDTPDQGVGYVRIAVNAAGGVSAATMYVSSGNVRLDRIAIASAQHDQFEPALRDGKPVASVYFHREDFVNTTKPR
ncbi:MAG TPA: hypothetical protein VIG51_01735 [Candidatus Baltobacteraceae bacterium]